MAALSKQDNEAEIEISEPELSSPQQRLEDVQVDPIEFSVEGGNVLENVSDFADLATVRLLRSPLFLLDRS